jgi:serine O-acetyltransferase
MEGSTPSRAPGAPPAPADRAGFWRLVREDHLSHGRDWTRPGFRALFMYRFGAWRMSVRPILLRKLLSVLYRAMHRYVRNHYGIELHCTARIGRRLRIAHQGAIVVHEHATIGDDCIIRQGVTLGAAVDERVLEAPVLGHGVEVGAGAVVIGKVRVGDGARIGPNAVVMTDVPAGATAFAPPARVVNLAPGGADGASQAKEAAVEPRRGGGGAPRRAAPGTRRRRSRARS